MSIPISRSKKHVISRLEAEHTDCSKLYEAAIAQTGTNDITIVIRPGATVDGKFLEQPAVKVPVVAKWLSDLIPTVFDEASITIEYTYGRNGFDPNEKMTRMEFVIQTLDVMDRLLPRIHALGNQTSVDEMITAMDLFKSIYSFTELDSSINMDEFRTYFDIEKETK